MDELMLDGLFQRAARLVAYPPTPAMRGRVLAAIAAPPIRSRGVASAPRFAVAALAAAIIAVIGAAFAMPSSRSAIAEFFGIAGSRIERLPTPVGGVSPTPLPTPEDIGVYASPSTLAAAEAAIGFTPATPLGEGEPEVFVARYPSEAAVILRYASFDLWEMQPREIFFGKGLPEGVVSLDTAVGGRPAGWIEGGPHVAAVFDENGAIPGSERTVARDTLIWRTDFALYRMETALPLLDAIRVAETLP